MRDNSRWLHRLENFRRPPHRSAPEPGPFQAGEDDDTAPDQAYQDDFPDFGDFPGAGLRGDPRWAVGQRAKEALGEGLSHIGRPERARALSQCCKCIVVHRYANGRVVRGAMECRDLVCPSGMRARSRRLMTTVGTAVERFLDQHISGQGIMVTLTARSVPSLNLAKQVHTIIRAIGALMRRKSLKAAVLAWTRSVELTRNAETGLWHVHAHLLWIVDRSAYFRRGSTLYVSAEKLRELWRKQLRADYDPVVDMRPLRGVVSPLSQEGRKSLREVLKYCFKPSSLVINRDGPPELAGRHDLDLYDAGDGRGARLMDCVPLRALCDALKSRRLISTSRNLQANDDLDATETIETADELGPLVCIEFYEWRLFNGRADYFLVGREFEPSAPERGWAMPP